MPLGNLAAKIREVVTTPSENERKPLLEMVESQDQPPEPIPSQVVETGTEIPLNAPPRRLTIQAECSDIQKEILRLEYDKKMEDIPNAVMAASAIKDIQETKAPIPYEVKTISELTDVEREEFERMNIDPADVDQILVTPHGLVVSTGGKRWIEALRGTKQSGKKPVSEVEMQQLKADYNRLLSELRKLEKNMTSEDIPAHGVLMNKLSKIYEAIVCGGYAITAEETKRGFKLTIRRREN